MLKLLLLTLSAWSVASLSFCGALGLLAHRRDRLALVRAMSGKEAPSRRWSRPYR